MVLTNLESRSNLFVCILESVYGSAFFATLSAHVSNIQDNQRLVFSRVTTNVGIDFDSSIGVFICSIPGTYVFHHTLLTFPTKWVETAIVKNEVVLAYVYAYAGTNPYYESSSASVVTNLLKGDKVFVRINGNQHSAGGNAIDWPYTTFSGFLLYPQND